MFWGGNGPKPGQNVICHWTRFKKDVIPFKALEAAILLAGAPLHDIAEALPHEASCIWYKYGCFHVST